jgi:hypothetical protein
MFPSRSLDEDIWRKLTRLFAFVVFVLAKHLKSGGRQVLKKKSLRDLANFRGFLRAVQEVEQLVEVWR